MQLDVLDLMLREGRGAQERRDRRKARRERKKLLNLLGLKNENRYTCDPSTELQGFVSFILGSLHQEIFVGWGLVGSKAVAVSAKQSEEIIVNVCQNLAIE